MLYKPISKVHRLSQFRLKLGWVKLTWVWV